MSYAAMLINQKPDDWRDSLFCTLQSAAPPAPLGGELGPYATFAQVPMELIDSKIFTGYNCKRAIIRGQPTHWGIGTLFIYK